MENDDVAGLHRTRQQRLEGISARPLPGLQKPGNAFRRGPLRKVALRAAAVQGCRDQPGAVHGLEIRGADFGTLTVIKRQKVDIGIAYSRGVEVRGAR